MNRLAILISTECSENLLNADTIKMQYFLQTANGGAWKTDEVVCIDNVERSSLNQFLRQYTENLDFLLLYISMQKDTQRNPFEVSLNKSGSTISEVQLEKWCDKQVNIFDFNSELIDFDGIDEIEEKYSSSNDTEEKLNATRKFFEQRLKNTKPRQLSLFPCAAKAAAKGGLYTQCLMDAANSLAEKDAMLGGEPFMWEKVHSLASGNVALETGGMQKPEIRK